MNLPNQPHRTWLTGADLLIDGAFRGGLGVLIEAGHIAGILPQSATPEAVARVLPPHSLLVPGLIDIQVNGGGGVLLNDAPSTESMRAIAAAHAACGTAAILPTLITASDETIDAAFDALSAPIEGVLGLHLEGPWLGPQKPGVHDPALIRAPSETDIDHVIARAQTLAGRLVITLAPETVPPAMIARLAAAGIVVCAGHSAASAEQTRAAIAAGVTGFTHLFNAMAPITARAPGIAAAALLSASAYCGVIADGVHVAPEMLALLLAAKPCDRIMLVSDAMPVCGTELSEFTLGNRKILRRNGILTTEEGTLAGADLCLLQAVRMMMRIAGVPAAAALSMASAVPAAFLGIRGERGVLAPGAIADLLLLDADINLLARFDGGEICALAGGV